MQNNDIMNPIVQDNIQTENINSVKKNTIIPTDQQEIPISRIRVVTAKYKVYIILLAIFICMFLMEIIPNVKNSYDSKMSYYQSSKSQLVTLQNEIKQSEQDMELLRTILTNENSLKNCLNGSNRNCSELPDGWKRENDSYDITIPLSYLQLHSLFNKKMPVDEKKVLKNLNEYLIKQDISGTSRTKVWDILKISIWDPESVTKWDIHFFEVPVDVSIRFTTIWDLTWFLYNVEKKLIDDPNDRILYKIQSVSYDIVSNDEPQTTDVSMLAYYYHDEKFENIDEATIKDVLMTTESSINNLTDSQDSTIEETTEEKTRSNNQSSGFLGEIFWS